MRLLATCLTTALTLTLLPPHSRATDQQAALEAVLGSQEPLYKVPAGELLEAIGVCAGRDPNHAGAYVTMVLRSGRTDADAIAPSVVRAAIQGLGPDPVSSLVAAIVRDAVRATPSEVLDIVTAAVKATPRDTARDIVSAAIGSVPHPEQLVTVNTQPRAERAITSDKQLDAKQLSTPAQKQLTLAEAIVQAAQDADPGLSTQSLTAAADSGLNSVFSGDRPAILPAVLPPVPPELFPPPGGKLVNFAAPGPVSP